MLKRVRPPQCEYRQSYSNDMADRISGIAPIAGLIVGVVTFIRVLVTRQDIVSILNWVSMFLS